MLPDRINAQVLVCQVSGMINSVPISRFRLQCLMFLNSYLVAESLLERGARNVDDERTNFLKKENCAENPLDAPI